MKKFRCFLWDFLERHVELAGMILTTSITSGHVQPRLAQQKGCDVLRLESSQ